MRPPAGRSYSVRIWNAAVYRGKRGKSYRVRWRTGSRTHGRTFATMKAAESFRSELLTAHRKGEPFDSESGLPPSMQPVSPSVTWLWHACDFVDFKWPRASARHRKGLAEALLQHASSDHAARHGASIRRGNPGSPRVGMGRVTLPSPRRPHGPDRVSTCSRGLRAEENVERTRCASEDQHERALRSNPQATWPRECR